MANGLSAMALLCQSVQKILIRPSQLSFIRMQIQKSTAVTISLRHNIWKHGKTSTQIRRIGMEFLKSARLLRISSMLWRTMAFMQTCILITNI